MKKAQALSMKAIIVTIGLIALAAIFLFIIYRFRTMSSLLSGGG